MKRISLSGILFLFLMTTCATLATAQTRKVPPNVVLIFVDDLGYGDLGCYGATKVQTPNIDRLAREGRRFTDAHSASAVCTPSRYGLLTGEYPVRQNIWGPAPSTSQLLVDTEKLTIADVFKNRGYNTAAVGKWHLGFGKGTNDWQQPLRPGPLDLGFDYYFGVPVVNSAPPYVFVENDRVLGSVADDPLVFLGRNAGDKATPITPLTEEHGNRVSNSFGGATAAHKLYNDFALGTTLVERSTKWIREQSDKPFFLYLATTNIHHPFTPAPRFQGTSQCGLYGDFIHELDWMVGEVMSTLEEKGVADNTLVILTSDNGGMFNHGGQRAFSMGHRVNGDLLGFKFGVWEGGHRVPFIARWPGKIKPGTTSTQLISGVDMLATFAALTQQTLDKEQLADSVNVLPALIGEPETPLRDTLVLCPNSPTHLAVRKGKWVYIGAQGEGGFNGKPGTHAAGGPVCASFVGNVNSDIEDGRIKKDAPPAQLYDLEADVNQTRNLHNEYPDVVKQLSSLLASYAPQKPGPRKGKAKAASRNEKSKAPGKPADTKPGAASSASAVDKPTRSPNFVVIFTDDQGYADVGCFGSPDIRTPRLDAMAAEGMRFTSFYAQPICGPSRAALMTGCYPMRVAERGNTKQVHPILHSDEITIAEILKTKGYATACFGKWDLAKHAQEGFFVDLFPTRQGFDYFFGAPTSNDRIANLYRNEELIEPDANMATLTRRYTDEAIDFMRKNKSQPFFVYIPHSMPHTRLDASPQFKGQSKRGLYGDVIEEIDFNVGRVLDAIREMNLADNTYVLFTSDNGPWLIKNKDHADGHLPSDHGGSAGRLRSGKASTFEGGMRVPCIVWGPGRVPSGKTCDSIASTLDVLPTLAALAGSKAPSDRVIDGEDIRHLIHGEFEKANANKAYYYYLRVHLQAVRQGKWKLHLPRDAEPIGAAPFRKNTHIAPADRIGFDAPFLVDLEHDLGETTNVADKHPQVTRQLLDLAESMRSDLGDFDRVGKNMRFFDLNGPRPTKPPVPEQNRPARQK